MTAFAEQLHHIDYIKCETISNAVRLAIEDAEVGDVILLAPACASFDQYESFEARGNDFINIVEAIDNENSNQ